MKLLSFLYAVISMVIRKLVCLVPRRPSAQWPLSAQGPEIYSNQTEGWSQAIAARPVELEKEIWFKKRF